MTLALNLGLGGTAPSGGAPFDSGLIANGTFDTDIAGWTNEGGTLTWEAGKAKVVSPGGAHGLTSGSSATTNGVTYLFTATVIADGANAISQSARIVLSGATGDTLIVTANGVEQTLTKQFVSAGGSLAVSLQCASGGLWGANGDFALFDNVGLSLVA